MRITNRRIRFSTAWIAMLALVGALSLHLNSSAQATPGFGVVKTINVDINPFGATLSPDGTTVWVTNSGTVTSNSDKVTLIDVATLTENPDKITVGEFPEDIRFGRLGLRAFITNSSSSTVSVVNVVTKAVEQTVDLSTVPLNFPYGLAVGLGNAQIFVTTQGDFNLVPVLSNKLSGVTIKTSILVPGFSGVPAVVPLNIIAPALSGKILVPVSPLSGPPEVDIIDPATDAVVNHVSIAGFDTASPNAIDVTPDGHFAYITLSNFSGGPGGVWVLDLSTLSTVTVINTGDPTVFGVRVSPNGTFALATNFLADTVALIRTATNEVVGTAAVGANPNEAAFTQNSREAFVTNQGDTTVSVLSIPAI